MGIMIPKPLYLDEEQTCLIKMGRYFNCKEKGHTTCDRLRKTKIAAILDSISKNSNNQKKVAFSKVKGKSLFVSSLFIPDDLFYKSFFTVQCILGNKINAIILIDTCATRYSFIDEKFASIVY